MEQIMRVRRNLSDGRAEVFLVRESACSGDCHKCAGCESAAKETMIVEAHNPIGARAGELVRVETATRDVMTAAFVVYMLPLVLFFGGYALGAWLGWNGAAAGGVGFVLGLLSAIALDRSKAKKNETVYTITGYAHQGL